MSEEEEHKIWRGKLSRCPLLNHGVPLRLPRDVAFLLLPALGIELETRIWLRASPLRGPPRTPRELFSPCQNDPVSYRQRLSKKHP